MEEFKIADDLARHAREYLNIRAGEIRLGLVEKTSKVLSLIIAGASEDRPGKSHPARLERFMASFPACFPRPRSARLLDGLARRQIAGGQAVHR